MSYNVKQRSNYRRVLRVSLEVLAAWLLLGAASYSQDKVSVPLTDPSRPAMVKAGLIDGSITVNAYDGKEVVVEAHVRKAEAPGREGSMKRIPINTTGLSVEEENNQVDISARSYSRAVDLTIQVPRRASLHLRTVNDGDISVTGVDGDLEVNDVNGSVTLKGVSGSVVAHALNGKVMVTFDRINPQKAMAFSSMNGDVDVTFPADLKANLSMSSDRGEVFSDFDIQLEPRAPVQTPVQSERKDGKFRVNVDKVVRGKINGGGPEIQFKNFNGNIYIRKAGAAGAAVPKE